jgi:hypothetical protein
VSNGKIGFGITAVDDNDSGNRNGIYKLQTYLNGKPNFGYQLDTYSFDEMRYINALIDYKNIKRLHKGYKSYLWQILII